MAVASADDGADASADDGSDQFMCALCRQVFKSDRGRAIHATRFCKGAPPDVEVAEPLDMPSSSTNGGNTSSGFASLLFTAAFIGLTKLRLKFNASNAQVQSVKDMVCELMAIVQRELIRIFPACHEVDTEDVPDLSEFIGPISDVFKGLRTEYLEGRAREALLPDLKPTRRVLGKRYIPHDLPDGRRVHEEVEDVVYDFDAMKHLQAMFEHVPHTRLDPSAQEWFKQQIGVRTFNHSFSRMPYGNHVQIAKDLMHAELLGNLKEHQSKMLWKMKRELKWITDASAFNTRVLSFPHWARGSRRRSYLLSDDAFSGSLQDCSVGGLWTAHNEMLFVCYSIELLHVFVPSGQEEHPVWRCWCLHYHYIMLCLQKEFTLDDIRELDQTIYDFQALYLEVYGEESWKPKFNFAQHFPLEILKYDS